MIYLAGPYSHENPTVRHMRFCKLTALAGLLMLDGKLVYSPITHSHHMSTYIGHRTDFEFWERMDLHMLGLSKFMYVFKMDGWKESTGVAAEIKFATREGIPVVYVGDMTLTEIKTKIGGKK